MNEVSHVQIGHNLHKRSVDISHTGKPTMNEKHWLLNTAQHPAPKSKKLYTIYVIVIKGKM